MTKNIQNIWILDFPDSVLTQIIEQLLSDSLNHNHLQEIQEGPSDQEALWEGQGLEVAHVQREGVVWRRHGAQSHHLTHYVPHMSFYRADKR